MRDVVCLYEASGLSARPWAVMGHDVYCYDIAHERRTIEVVGLGHVIKMPWDATAHNAGSQIIERHLQRSCMGLAFPPCTHLAVSGAAHFARKKAANPNYRAEAMAMVYLARDIFETLGVRYAIENPVSVISTEWRKPDYIFHPHEYGGYLPEDDVHPEWPEYILPRDAYPKKTCYWTGNGFVMPPKMPVEVAAGYSLQHTKLGGKSARTKSIRSASPRGIAMGIYIANTTGDNT